MDIKIFFFALAIIGALLIVAPFAKDSIKYGFTYYVYHVGISREQRVSKTNRVLCLIGVVVMLVGLIVNLFIT